MHSKSLLHLVLVAEDPEKQQNSSKKAHSKRFNREELGDETKTFLMAGHETTTTWMHWCFYALAKHPDVQEKLYQTIVQHAPAEGPTQLEHTQKMEYLLALITRSLAHVSSRWNLDSYEQPRRRNEGAYYSS